MKNDQLQRMRDGMGFIAALDQSGGSTPKALAQYGIPESAYAGEAAMFDLVHAMRARIMTSPAFSGASILGAILFENTMDRMVEGELTADYLWNQKNIVPILKVDKGLEPLRDGVQLMKPMPDLESLLERAAKRNIFGTKMRSVIKSANREGIKKVVAQQFEVGKQIIAAGLIPIIEPEVDIHSADKAESETILKEELLLALDTLNPNQFVMLKLSIPSVDDFYKELIAHPQVVRVVALSGGYSREEANEKLTHNPGLIASFSRALSEGLSAGLSDDEFRTTLADSIQSIYDASIV